MLGDAHLDVIVTIAGPVIPDTDTPARTMVSPGGQAANVAAWVAALDASSRLVAAQTTDAAGRLVAADLAGRGVDLVGPVVAGHTGVVVSLSETGSRRSMLTDRGVGPLLSAADVQARWLDGCSWLHLPAYSLVIEPVRGAALAAAAAARTRSVRVSVDLSSTAAITRYGVGEFTRLLSVLAPDLVFGNQAEADLVGGSAGTEMIVKLGAAGVVAGGRHYPALRTEPVDATGAGDAFAAGYLVGGVQLGLEAAARAVATMGAMP